MASFSENDLWVLITALRNAGLGVGVTEVERLRRVIDLGPAWSDDPEAARARLRSVLRAVLLHRNQDVPTFDRVFASWLEAIEARTRRTKEWSSVRPEPRIKDTLVDYDRLLERPSKPTDSFWQRHRKKLIAACALSILFVLVIIVQPWQWFKPKPIIPDTPNDGPTGTSEQVDFSPLSVDEILQRKYRDTVPVLKVIPGEPRRPYLPWIPLGLAGLGAAGFIIYRYRHLREEAEPRREPGRRGPERQFFPDSGDRHTVLLGHHDQDTMVWGIDRFTAEESTRRLDLAASARATARAAGIPHPIFEQARYHREVWLWLDDACDDSAMVRLADEVETALTAHGLAVERAWFRGIPERLLAGDGRFFMPREVDERRDLAMVAVCTDGRLLAARHRTGPNRLRVESLLRYLSHWPRLAFVDFGKTDSNLAALLSPHELRLLRPDELADFLGSGRAPVPTGSPTGRDDLAWAALCALAPAPLAENAALALRHKLKLDTPTWTLRRLRAKADATPGRLHWSREQRARLLRWLILAEGKPDDGVTENSLLDQGLAWHEDRYKTLLATAPEASWRDTPAQLHFEMEQMLVKLFRKPREAIKQLHALYEGPLAATVGRHLNELRPWDLVKNETHVPLPWCWTDLDPVSRDLLRQIVSWREELPEFHLRRSGRFYLALGIAAGLACVAFGFAVLGPSRLPKTKPEFSKSENPPPLAIVRLLPDRRDPWLAEASTPRRLATAEAGPGAVVEVEWRADDQDCVEKLPENTAIWRCGGVGIPARVNDQSRRALAVLKAGADDPTARELAKALLAGGSVDQVLLDSAWPRYQEKLLGPGTSLEADRLFLLLETDDGQPGTTGQLPPSGFGFHGRVTDFGDLISDLEFAGIKPLNQAWQNIGTVAGDPAAIRLGGIGACQPTEFTEKGITFVQLCGGDFVMGSADDDELAASDEKPAHRVTLSPFAIGRSEITNAQYRQVVQDHEPDKDDNLPVVNVRWNDADAYCQTLGYRLPTEAEWEYACRAGTVTSWSHGSDEPELDRYAWYSKNSDYSIHPVAQKLPNPWGLYDMHGNAWEWVADWYGDYEAGDQQDPVGPTSGSDRVLRGGSFYVVAGFLRSAGRFRIDPSGRGRYVGFRCVRAPRPQH